ncbi:MAG: glycosyltransferase family 4 protein [Patescibacteria group bacterium]
MKLIVFSPYFYPHTGGLENYCLEISNRLARLGHAVTVVASKFDNEPAEETLNSIRVIRLESKNILRGTFPYPILNRQNHLVLTKLFRDKPDKIVTNTRFFPLTLIALIYSKKFKVPSIHIEHGTCHPKLVNTGTRLLAKFYDYTLGRLVFLLADRHLAISKAAADFSKRLGGKKVKVVYNSVDSNVFLSQRKTASNFIGIIFIGRLIEAKGVQDLIRALKKIKNDKLRLTIVGEGNYRNELADLATDDARITFLGEKSFSEIKTILAENDIFVNPSYSEGLPTSLLEAGASGLAVIASNTGGTDEIIDNGKNGFLFEPGKQEELVASMKRLVENSNLRKMFGQEIKKTIEDKFDWDHNILALEKEVNK